ncbi:MAG: hypothetical protein AAGM67_13055, partial [Bacteroidota bacterium]
MGNAIEVVSPLARANEQFTIFPNAIVVMRTLLTILYFAFFLSIFSIPASVWSQPRLEAEIDQIVTVLVEQINREEGVKTIAIADFTDLGYQPNLLGKQLAEEFLSAFVRARDKNFRMISRSMYEALRAE